MTDVSAQLGWQVGRGLSIPLAREVRLVVRDGVLWLHEPHEQPRSIGPLAHAYLRTAVDVRRMRRWPADSLVVSVLGRMPRTGIGGAVATARDELEDEGPTGAMVLAGDSGPVIAVHLPDFMPPGALIAEGWSASGAGALIDALGLELHPAPPPDRRRLTMESRILLRPRRRLLARARTVHALFLASALFTLVALERGADWPSPLAAAAAVLLVAGIAGLVLGKRRFLAVAGTRLDAAGRAIYDVPGDSCGVQVQMGREEVVVVLPHQAEEIWLGGPATRGVARVQVGRAEVQLRNADGIALMSFSTAELVPSSADADRLRSCCAAAGVTCGEGGFEADLGEGRTQPTGRTAGAESRTWMSPEDTGDGGLSIPITGGVAAVMGLIAPLGPGVDLGPVAWLLIVGHLLCLAAVAWGAWSLWRWRRSAHPGVRP